MRQRTERHPALWVVFWVERQHRRGRTITETNDDLWRAFELLAKTYPQDHGVRMTADLARWMIEERQRLKLSPPPMLAEVVQNIAAVLVTTSPEPRPAQEIVTQVS